MIDLRSDTVTKPTPQMRDAIANAEVGDDMNGEDPTVNRLEELVANLFEKEAAVFACSGTQSNQMGVRTHCIPGDELLIEELSHIGNYEGGAAAALSGVSVRPIAGVHGMLDVPDVVGKIRSHDQHMAHTKLLCVENTTNAGGGRAYPLDQLQRIGDWAHEHGLKTHLDGARLFNAAVARRYRVADACRSMDTVSVCFSKGLGCPMGAVLVGAEADIARARRIRKIFGGALRQAGIVAAAAIHALEHNVERLADDHERAQAFAAAIADTDGIQIDLQGIETNLVYFHVEEQWGYASQLSAMLRERGVRIGSLGPRTLRACLHLDVSREDALQAAAVVNECMGLEPPPSPIAPYGPFYRA